MNDSQTFLIGKTAYWNLCISDFCKVFDTYAFNQPHVTMTVRPSKDGDKIVVRINIDSAKQAAFFLAAIISVEHKPKEGVDYVLR